MMGLARKNSLSDAPGRWNAKTISGAAAAYTLGKPGVSGQTNIERSARWPNQR